MSQLLLAAFAFSLFGALVLGPLAIPFLRRLKFGQRVRDEGPKSHLSKAGTPTMGAVIFLLPALLATVVWAPFNTLTLLVLLATISHGLLGFLDDFLKISKKRSLGLRAREKLAVQVAIAVFVALVASLPATGTPSSLGLGLGTALRVPYLNLQLDLGLYYIPFVVLLFLGTANAVNLTDGLDGLLAGSSLVTFAAYALIALARQQLELATFALTVAGGSLGFLWYNRHPARVFMGDTGSLALGGALATLAVLTKTELFLVVLGGLYVLEALSVILQVASYRLTGRRIFRMSPLHHHFELMGWPETKVVARFWLANLLFTAAGLYLWLH